MCNRMAEFKFKVFLWLEIETRNELKTEVSNCIGASIIEAQCIHSVLHLLVMLQ